MNNANLSEVDNSLKNEMIHLNVKGVDKDLNIKINKNLTIDNLKATIKYWTMIDQPEIIYNNKYLNGR